MGRTMSNVLEPHPLQRDADELRLINRAKSLLMSNCDLTEAQAHRCLQKISMETSRPMTVVAQQLIGAFGRRVD